MPPASEPTPLQLVTLAIAIGGFIVAGISLVLTVRRDRALGRVGVRIVVSVGQEEFEGYGADLRLTLSNPERRTVTVMSAGFNTKRWRARRTPFTAWEVVDIPGSSVKGSPFAGGRQFEPGDPAYTVRAKIHRVRSALFPDVARWVWCEDSIGGVHWAPIPASVQKTIKATKRRKFVLESVHHSRVSVEVEDSEPVDPTDLNMDPFSY